MPKYYVYYYYKGYITLFGVGSKKSARRWLLQLDDRGYHTMVTPYWNWMAEA